MKTEREEKLWRLGKSMFVSALIYLIGWVCFGDVASTNLMVGLFLFATAAGGVVYILDLDITG